MNNAKIEQRWLTLQELCAYVGCNRPFALKLAEKAGALTDTGVSDKRPWYRVDKYKIDAYMEGNSVK